jgi:hypothetical protein
MERIDIHNLETIGNCGRIVKLYEMEAVCDNGLCIEEGLGTRVLELQRLLDSREKRESTCVLIESRDTNIAPLGARDSRNLPKLSGSS